MRPLGAIFIEAYFDRAGRKPGLILSAGLLMIYLLLVVGWIVATTGDPTSPGIYLGVVMLLSLTCLAASARLLGGAS